MVNPYATPQDVTQGDSTLASLIRFILRVTLAYVGVVLGVNLALSAIVGIDQTLQRAGRDPLGMLGALSVITVVSLVAATIYRLLRKRLFTDRQPPTWSAIAFGSVFGATMVGCILVSSKLVSWLLDPRLRDLLPTNYELTFLLPALMISTSVAVEAEHFIARIRARASRSNSPSESDLFDEDSGPTPND